MKAPRILAQLVDQGLEASVVGSFSRVGYAVRSRLEPWPELPRQVGRVHLVTGASSGIGRAVALQLGGLGAEVWVVGRDEDRTGASAEAVRAAGGRAEVVTLDITDPDGVGALCKRLAATHDQVHGLVHAAGALTRDYRMAADGMELTVATAVVGPFRLTAGLAPLLRAGAANVVTVSSGGMYAEPFDLARLVGGPEDYDGVRAYARAKRAQVVLAHEWARRLGPSVASYACHPGWVDTPGLATGLPGFARLGPLLRTADEGADTAAWLAAGGARRPVDGSTPATEGFFHDRRLRTEHRLHRTRRASVPDDGAHLWAWCETVTRPRNNATA
jgi:NAD(P)-dependent dehydrogenase (short-subunit alcohol dehydrogenase family)